LKARIVAATNQDLEALQRSGEFRKDLYYRLRTHLIQIPPLRERRDDLQLLLDYFLQQSADELGKPKPTPPRELLTLLGTYEFPGNVRELKAIVFDAVTVHQSYKLSMEHFKQAIGHGNGSNGAERGGIGDSEAPAELVFPSELPTLKEASRQLIDAAMERAGGNQGIAASLLGMSRPALNKRLKKLEEEED
jgi:DNA-binding NtrC family response regulator